MTAIPKIDKSDHPFVPLLARLKEFGIEVWPAPLSPQSAITTAIDRLIDADLLAKYAEGGVAVRPRLRVAMEMALEDPSTARFSKKIHAALVRDYIPNLITNEELSRVCETYKRLLAEGGDPMRMRVALPDDINWQDGEYGHSGSCWWSTEYDTRYMATFVVNWGHAILEYDSRGDGVGRTWVYPHTDGHLLLFNRYKDNYGEDVEAVTMALEERLRKLDPSIKLAHEKVAWSPVFYENGDSISLYLESRPVRLVTSTWSRPHVPQDEQQVEYHEWIETPQGKWFAECANNYSQECCSCGYEVDEDNIWWVDGNPYCSDCYHDIYFECQLCYEYHRYDDCDPIEIRIVDSTAHWRNGTWRVCEECAKKEGYKQCGWCDEWHKDCRETTQGEWFCDVCADRHDIALCEECLTIDELTHRQEAPDGTIIERICRDCAPAWLAEHEETEEQTA